MIDAIIRFSIQQKLIVIFAVFGLIGWGVYSLQHLPIDAVPDITDNQIQVITTSPTLAAQEVEKFITYPLEMHMGNIPRVEEIRSVSRFGLSVITVVFEESVDIYWARQLISEKIKVAEEEIPEEMGKPEMGPITTGLGEIYQYVIYPAEGYEDQYSAMELRTIQDWVVKRQLTGLKGVIEVNSSGGFLKQYEVAIKPEKLRSMGVTLSELFEALERNNANTGGSYIEKKHYTYFIRGEGMLEDMKAIEEVVVKTNNGTPVLVRDVATVGFGNAPRFGAVTMNGIGEVVAGQVMMLKGENSAEVTERVKERMEQIKASLPEGVVIEPYLDRTKLVNRTTRTVVTNLVEGGLIVIFVLVLLLGNMRAGLIVASVIPLSMLFAVSMMRIFGVSANLMSLGAIDFGLIVDGAVIIVESIVHFLSVRFTGKVLTQQQLDEAVFSASTRIRKSAAFGEIIILIVYLPILFLIGIEGKMFRPMAQTVSFAILGALILSLTYVPMMAALVLNRKWVERRTIADRIMGFLQNIYRPTLTLAFRLRGLVLAITILLFAMSLWTFSRMGGEFIPTLEEGDFALHQILPGGSSIAQGVEVSAELQNILLDKFPEVEKVVTKIGTAEIPTDIMPLEAGDIYVILKPKEEWTSAKTREEMFEKMEAELSKFPGVIYEFTQPIQMRFNELMTGVRQDIAIKIYGDNLGILQQKAQEAKGLIEQLNGVGDIQVEPVEGLQQIVVRYDRAKVAKYGLDIETLNKVLRTGFAGEKAGVIFEGERRYDLVVRLTAEAREDIEQVQQLYVPLPMGGQVPLQEVATVTYREGPAQISRDDTKRRIVIGVNARNRDVESLVSDIREQLGENLILPTSYYVTFGGQFENLIHARARLAVALPVALLLIFLLLYFTFNSVIQTILIYTAIPLSAIGGIWALYLRDMPFSISAGVGFIALFGVAVLNGIVLIAQFNQLKKDGTKSIVERIYEGTRLRLRPVVMTAAVASLGFLPMAISTSAGAEVQQPLATVVIGGLVTATFLTLIVLPILYYYSEKWSTNLRMSKAALIVGLISLGGTIGAQPALTLEEALQLAQAQNPTIQQADLRIQQQQSLIGAAYQQPMGTLSLSSEEYDFSAGSGIHSFNVNQAFNLPGTMRKRKAVREAQAGLAQQQRQLTVQQLNAQLSGNYYRVVWARQRQALLQAIDSNYADLERIAQAQFDAGVTGRVPVLQAQNKRQELQLQQTSGAEDYRLAVAGFNQWLLAEQTYTVALMTLPPPQATDTLKNMRIPAALQVLQQQQTVAENQLAATKVLLNPQLQTGLQFQMVEGVAPFWGYQLGVNVPLFRKGQRAQIEAAQVGVAVAEKALESTTKRLDRQRDYQLQQMRKNWRQYEQLQNELLPLTRENASLIATAYQSNNASYLDYILVLERLLNYQLQAVDYLLQYHQARVQWAVLSGQ
jgi:cobalt-zinc-cadmium resistance protein CzcA